MLPVRVQEKEWVPQKEGERDDDNVGRRFTLSGTLAMRDIERQGLFLRAGGNIFSIRPYSVDKVVFFEFSKKDGDSDPVVETRESFDKNKVFFVK